MSLSLCMIVRNEARVLGRCLASAAPFVDEIILVDTGSTDGTREIGEMYGAVPATFSWCDDFSAARNHSLELACRPWILILDADEVLRVEDGERFRAQLASPHLGSLLVRLRNDLGEGKSSETLTLRCFRNHPDVRFEGLLHERVDPSLREVSRREGWETEEAAIRIEHDGYRPEVLEGDKRERYFRLFQRALEKEGEDPYLLYKIAVHALLRGDDSRTTRQELLTRAWKLLSAMPDSERSQRPFAPEVLAQLALEISQTGAHRDALDLILAERSRVEASPNVFFLLARLLQSAGRHREALPWFDRALEFRGRVRLYSEFEGATDFASLTHRAESRWLLGDADGARTDFDDARSITPDVRHAFLSPIEELLDGDEGVRALRLHLERLRDHPADATTRGRALAIARALGQVRAVSFLSNLDRRHEPDAPSGDAPAGTW